VQKATSASKETTSVFALQERTSAMIDDALRCREPPEAFFLLADAEKRRAAT
jgi:hypothetical protein